MKSLEAFYQSGMTNPHRVICQIKNSRNFDNQEKVNP